MLNHMFYIKNSKYTAIAVKILPYRASNHVRGQCYQSHYCTFFVVDIHNYFSGNILIMKKIAHEKRPENNGNIGPRVKR